MPATKSNEQESTVEAETRLHGCCLPERLVRLIDPAVFAERVARIESRAQDIVGERVRRRRCAEIIASHLLEAHSHG